VRRVNLVATDFDHSSERDGHRWQGLRVGKALGAERIGASIYEVAAGEWIYTYHFHYGMEEWLLVLEGTPTVRSPAGERELRAGDVVCFPVGPDGAHCVRGPGRVLILSANQTPAVAAYPDSGKVGALPPGKVFRLADAVDYWEGE
jgi:uncharacterized cupin superfamily protein